MVAKQYLMGKMRGIKQLLIVGILLATNHLVFSQGYENYSELTFSEAISNGKISMPNFLKEIKQDSTFFENLKIKLNNAINTGILSKKDSSLVLNLTLTDSSKISVDNLVKMINAPSNEPFKNRLMGNAVELTSLDSKTDGSKLSELQPDLIISNLTKNDDLKEMVLNAFIPIHLKLWWVWIILAALLTFLICWFFMKRNSKEPNAENIVMTFFNHYFRRNGDDEFQFIGQLIEYIQTTGQSDISKEFEGENRKNKKTLFVSEKELGEWREISGKKSIIEVKEFLENNGFYNNSAISTELDDEELLLPQSVIFYFSDLNKTGDFGVFLEENKKLNQKDESLYKIEIIKDLPNKAKFYLLETSSAQKAVLEYPFFKLEPFCEVQNENFPIKKEVQLLSHGIAELEGTKWVVKEKAKVKYV